MTKLFIGRIPVIIYTLKEMKVMDFYEKNKNISVSELAQKYDISAYEVRKWLEAGQMLKRA